MSHQIDFPITIQSNPAWSAHCFNSLERALKWVGRWPPPWQGAPHPFIGSITCQIRSCRVYTHESKEIFVSLEGVED